MDCYKEPETIPNKLISRIVIMLVIFMFAIHDTRKSQIKHFIAKERSKK